jgi:Virulence-associated protein E-like domain/Bifunctional DNA primase/polymerase, N-terminal/Primase C terminal 1 (PriCT-1)
MTIAPPQPAVTSPMLEWALWYAALGWPVFPCRGKRPLTDHGLREASTDLEQIRRWWTHTPRANIATVLGDGRWALDVDARSDGLGTLHDLEQTYSPLPRTVTNLTGSGGGSCHLLWTGEAQNKANLGPGLDVQGPGSYIILPPSRHPTTRQRYLWEADFGPDDLEVQPAPAWLAALVDPSAVKTPAAPLDPDEPIRQGQREKTLLRLAGAMRRVGTPFVAIRAALEAENARCQPPLPGKDLDRIAKSVERYAPAIEKNGQGAPGWPGREETPSKPRTPLDPESARTDWYLARVAKYTNKQGIVEANDTTICAFLRNHPYWQGKLWWNALANRPMVDDEALDDHKLTRIGEYFGEHHHLPIRTTGTKLAKCIAAVCQDLQRDPLQEYLSQLPGWDMRPRLETWLCDCGGVRNTAYSRFLSRMLIVSMIARAYDPGCLYRYVVVLQGPEEFRKSTFVANMVPDPAWQDTITESFDSKDMPALISALWVAELSELDSLSRTEETRLKSFLSKRSDSYVPKWGLFRVSPPRRTIFIGTTNEHVWLKSSTGNTRWLPIKILHPMDVEAFVAIREQLYAEAIAWYGDHLADWWSMPQEVEDEARDEREERREQSVYEGTLAPWLEKGRFNDEKLLLANIRPGKDYTTWEEIAVGYLKMDTPERWKDMGMQKQVGTALKALGWYQTVIKDADNRSKRVWKREAPIPF